jgi:hypothetical protein
VVLEGPQRTTALHSPTAPPLRACFIRRGPAQANTMPCNSVQQTPCPQALRAPAGLLGGGACCISKLAAPPSTTARSEPARAAGDVRLFAYAQVVADRGSVSAAWPYCCCC